MDCRFCFYYTWEHALLCAVDPITAQSGEACNCKHYDYDPNFIVDGRVMIDSPEHGYLRAVKLPYRQLHWMDVDHDCPGIIVTDDIPEHHFMRAVDLPDFNVYEDDFVDNDFDED